MTPGVDLPDLARHTPVLAAETLRLLAVVPGGSYLDGTVGGGGHAALVLEESLPDGRLLGLDRDASAIARAKSRLAKFGSRAVLRQGSFSELDRHAKEAGFGQFNGLLFDLGISSDQLDDPNRGLSFGSDGPLDMRMDPTGPVTAADLVNGLQQDELADLIFTLGEEPRSRRIAAAIVRARPIWTTTELAAVVARGAGYRGGRTHPATRSFQALRIAVNDELMTLSTGLDLAVEAARPTGRIAVISFHSLEDRIVKTAFRERARDCICPPELPECRCSHTATLALITRKPVVPSAAEVAANPRSRSAKLRVAEKLPQEPKS